MRIRKALECGHIRRNVREAGHSVDRACLARPACADQIDAGDVGRSGRVRELIHHFENIREIGLRPAAECPNYVAPLARRHQ